MLKDRLIEKKHFYDVIGSRGVIAITFPFDSLGHFSIGCQ